MEYKNKTLWIKVQYYLQILASCTQEASDLYSLLNAGVVCHLMSKTEPRRVKSKALVYIISLQNKAIY